MANVDVETIIVGGGQAGLALAYELQQRQRDVLVLEAHAAVGESWRSRWDSLRLFTPAPVDGLPGMPFPRGAGMFPGKDAVADYLASYAAHFGLPLKLNTPVSQVRQHNGGFVVTTGDGGFSARRVVAATGPFQRAFVPQVAAQLSPDVAQVHSSAYRNPSQLPPGPALVVGGANSGVQIAEELARTRPVTLSVGERLPSVPRALCRSVLFWRAYLRAGQHVTTNSPLGRVFRDMDALFGTSLGRLRRRGVAVVGRTIRAAGRHVVFAGGGQLAPRSVVWATGYSPDYGWLPTAALDPAGRPLQRYSESVVPGLYFLGLPWQRYVGSALLGGVGSDAALLAGRLATSASKKAS